MRFVAAGLGALAVLLLGCGGVMGLLEPEDPPAITVVGQWAGADPAAVEHALLEPMEAALMSMPGLGSLEGTAYEGSAVLRMEAGPGVANQDELMDQLLVRLEELQGALPEDAELLLLHREEPPPAVRVALAGEGWEACAEQLADRYGTTLRGRQGQRVVVRVDPARLHAYGIDLADLARDLQRWSTAAPGDLLNAVLASQDGQPIYLRDIATIAVELDPADPLLRLNGQQAGLIESSGPREAIGPCPDPFPEAAWLDPDTTVSIDLELAGPPDGAIASELEAIAANLEPDDVLLEQGLLPHPALSHRVPTLLRLWASWDDALPPHAVKELVGMLRSRPGVTVRGWEGPGSRAALWIQGEDREALQAVAETIVDQLWVPEQETVLWNEGGQRQEQILVQPDRARSAALGITALSMSQALRTAIACQDLGSVRDAMGTMPIVLCGFEGDEPSLDDLPGVLLRAADGSMVPLGSVAAIHLEAVPTALHRRDGQRALPLRITSTEPSQRALEKRLLGLIERLELPAGVSVELGG